ncbi:uncharacterized protein BT62DRAFT_1072741 [Guyanagaster necrorhizus]|uniref:Uncharacterized protein n=1 Tax=Guyanagaster necrorhizus TaxID=856835 RepID=A0A9P7VZY1_9AGAR|nr:uncharacterized protein BT62DRAFT_1072741 [Guyanagaster necrorhizus MCA 3950]KAG7450706.1 hypothetical protein BT62DRAFT_1072741 [Guyanagaster necrorhizus MCA 3950]
MILDRPPSSSSTILPDYATSEYSDLENSRPPRYWTHERPEHPVTYTFTNWNSKTMLLIPPPNTGRASGSESLPSYTISVSLNLNPFLPISYVTSVHRVGSEDNLLLGEFELAINHSREILMMRGFNTRISNVLSNIQSSPRHWWWGLGGISLRWDCRTALEDGSFMCICYAADESRGQLATFIPPPIASSPPLPDPMLTVFPDGHQFFDHILISALIIERKMTTS